MTSRVIEAFAVMVVIAFTKHRFTETVRGDFTPCRAQRCSPPFTGKACQGAIASPSRASFLNWNTWVLAFLFMAP